MSTTDIILITIVAIILVAALAYFIYKFCSLSKEEKKETLKQYVCGAIVLAENALGSGTGEKKLAMVEEYFNEKAPAFYKLLLLALGKDNLKDIIEEALAEVKKGFEKSEK